MAIETRITTGTTARSSTAFSIAAGATIVVGTNIDLPRGVHVTAERSFDGGATWRAMDSGVLCSNKLNENTISGIVTTCRLSITESDVATIVYTDE